MADNADINVQNVSEQKKLIPFAPKKELADEYYLVCIPELGPGFLPITKAYHAETAAIPFPGQKEPWKIRTLCLGEKCAKCRHNKATYRFTNKIPYQAKQQIKRSFLIYLVYKEPSGEFRFAQTPTPFVMEYAYRMDYSTKKVFCEDWTNLLQTIGEIAKAGINPFDPNKIPVIKVSAEKQDIPNTTYKKTVYKHSFSEKTVSLPAEWKEISSRYHPIGSGIHELDDNELSQLVDVGDKLKPTYQLIPGGIVIVKQAIYESNIAALKAVLETAHSLKRAFEYYSGVSESYLTSQQGNASPAPAGLTSGQSSGRSKTLDAFSKDKKEPAKPQQAPASVLQSAGKTKGSAGARLMEKEPEEDNDSSGIFEYDTVAGSKATEGEFGRPENEKPAPAAPFLQKVSGENSTPPPAESTEVEDPVEKISMSDRLNSSALLLQKLKENFPKPTK